MSGVVFEESEGDGGKGLKRSEEGYKGESASERAKERMEKKSAEARKGEMEEKGGKMGKRKGEEESERRGETREAMVAINRTGTQPVDFSGVTFARERGGKREIEGEREREKLRRLPRCH